MSPIVFYSWIIYTVDMKEKNLTDGTIFKKLILFALPMMAGNLLQQVYNLVDTLVVGKFIGSHALAAVGSSYTLMTFITSIIIGLCMGSGTIFSSDYGADNHRKLKQDIWLSLVFILIVTMIILLIIYPFHSIILNIMQIPKELLPLTKDYILIVFLGIFFIFTYNFFAYLLRSLGNSFIPLIFLSVSSVINIILDIYFVVELQMGVKGVAIATVIAQMISGIGIALYSIFKVSDLSYDANICKYDSKRMKEIIQNDLMTGMQQSVMNFGILLIQGLVNSFGTIIMAAFAAAVKIDTIAYMPAQEFGNAYSLFTSQNFGAKKIDRIKEGTRIAMITSIIFCLISSLIIFIFAKELMMLFIKDSEIETIIAGVHYLRIEGTLYIGIGILFLWYGYFRAISKPQISLLLTIISLGTRVLLSYAFANAFGVTIIWLSIPIGWILADLAGIYLYLRVKIENENIL